MCQQNLLICGGALVSGNASKVGGKAYLFPQVGKYLVDDGQVLYTGNDLEDSAAIRTGFHRATLGSMLNILFNR